MSFDQVYELIETLAAQHPDALSSADDISANLIITGAAPGTIGAALKNGHLTLQKDLVTPEDVRVTASADDLIALVSGNLSPMTAIMTGRLRISGNMSKLMKIMAKYRK